LKDAPDSDGASQQSDGASRPRETNKYINHTIQEISVFDWNSSVSPNNFYESLRGVLNNYPRHDEGIVFSFLSDIETDPHYGFHANFPNGNLVKGTAAVVLISSAHKSNKPVSLGDGYPITTEKVKDRLRHATGLLGAHAPSPLLRSVAARRWMAWLSSMRISGFPVQTAPMCSTRAAQTHCLIGSNPSGPLASSSRRGRPHPAAPRKARLWHPRALPV